MLVPVEKPIHKTYTNWYGHWNI